MGLRGKGNIIHSLIKFMNGAVLVKRKSVFFFKLRFQLM